MRPVGGIRHSLIGNARTRGAIRPHAFEAHRFFGDLTFRHYHDGPVPDDGIAVKSAHARVLFVDDDPSRSAAVRRFLASAGFAAVGARRQAEALDRLRVEMFDAVVCETRVQGELADEVITWVGRCSPSLRVVVLGSEAGVAERFDALGVRTVSNPDDHAGLVDVLRGLGVRRGFFGNSIEVELFDYVQMVALTGRDKLVEVDTPRGLGRIWFEHGDIVHAEFDQFRGELAFYKMLAAGRGTFREALPSPPPKRTIVRSSTHLLMEAARQTDEGTLGQTGTADEDEETSFGDLMEEADTGEHRVARPAEPPPPPPAKPRAPTGPNPPVITDAEASGAMLAAAARSAVPDDDFVALVSDAIQLEGVEAAGPGGQDLGPADSMMGSISEVEAAIGRAPAPAAPPQDEPSQLGGGHAVFEDPETRAAMLDQFWQFEGINGVAIISSTGKVLAEDMRNNSSLVTLAGFYMRGAARIARTLGYNVFDGVVARSVQGQQMVMVSMGAASAVLSVEPGADPEAVRDAVMGVE